jgi:hypothetical protein
MTKVRPEKTTLLSHCMSPDCEHAKYPLVYVDLFRLTATAPQYVISLIIPRRFPALYPPLNFTRSFLEKGKRSTVDVIAARLVHFLPPTCTHSA